jgi:hypothetical protein
MLTVPYFIDLNMSVGLHQWDLTYSDGQTCQAAFICAGAKYHPVLKLNSHVLKAGEQWVWTITGAKPNSIVSMEKVEGFTFGDLPQGDAPFPDLINIDDNGTGTNAKTPLVIPSNALGDYTIKFVYADGLEDLITINVAADSSVTSPSFSPVVAVSKPLYNVGDPMVFTITGGRPNTNFVLYQTMGGDYGSFPAEGRQYSLDNLGSFSNQFDPQNSVPNGAAGSYTFKVVFFDNSNHDFNFAVAVYTPTFTMNKLMVYNDSNDVLTWKIKGAQPMTQVSIDVEGPNWNGVTSRSYPVDASGMASNSESITKDISVGQYEWTATFENGFALNQKVTVNSSTVSATPITITPTTTTPAIDVANLAPGLYMTKTYKVQAGPNLISTLYYAPEPVSLVVIGRPGDNFSVDITYPTGKDAVDSLPTTYSAVLDTTGRFNYTFDSSAVPWGTYRFKATVAGVVSYQTIEIYPDTVVGKFQGLIGTGTVGPINSTGDIVFSLFYTSVSTAVIEKLGGPDLPSSLSNSVFYGKTVSINAPASDSMVGVINASTSLIYPYEVKIVEHLPDLVLKGLVKGQYTLRATFDNGTISTTVITLY